MTRPTVFRRMLRSQAVRVQRIRDAFGQRSWSQEGEDRILWRLLDYQSTGFYVDVGAHHPFRFSNTCLLHKAGWSGINIDAMPGSMTSFRRHRPGDINLEIGIAETAGSAPFYVFVEPALNTFETAIAAANSAMYGPVQRTIDVRLAPLSDILAEHRPAGPIDLLTVDAEGRDLGVLRSNDWQRFRPRVVLAESLGRNIASLAADPCAAFMESVGYAAFAKTVNTVIYVDASAACEP